MYYIVKYGLRNYHETLNGNSWGISFTLQSTDFVSIMRVVTYHHWSGIIQIARRRLGRLYMFRLTDEFNVCSGPIIWLQNNPILIRQGKRGYKVLNLTLHKSFCDTHYYVTHSCLLSPSYCEHLSIHGYNKSLLNLLNKELSECVYFCDSNN